MRLNVSYIFIRRPIATFLLSLGLFLAGAMAYVELPVASLPSVDLPTIRVQARYPGASPEVMAATVAAPLERRLGEIAGVSELTSNNTLGSSNITVQFDIERDVEGAARDVQAAINAAQADLPAGMPTQPTLRKTNPAGVPIIILTMSSKTLPMRAVYDAADTVVGPRISQVEGVAEVSVSGGEQPAVRVQVDPRRLASMGVGLEDVRRAIDEANVRNPMGTFDGAERSLAIGTNGQIDRPEDYADIPVKLSDGTLVRLSSLAEIEMGSRSRLNAGWSNKDPAVLLFVRKTAEANVVETVERIKAMLPELGQYIPAGVDLRVLNDRTAVIQASVFDLQITLVATVILVMLVVFVFLRRIVPTLAAGVAVPLSLAGTVGVMWLLGYSLNNLSLMALTISVGFVVDDAIVVIENLFSNLERGMKPLRAALVGSRQIGFTVVAISVSLVAAFIPILFLGGIPGRLLREFSVTLATAVLISAVVSLVVTPVICAYFIKQAPRPRETWIDRRIEPVLDAVTRLYARTLRWALNHGLVMGTTVLIALGLSVLLFIVTPKIIFPQDDTGMMWGATRGSPDISFAQMKGLQEKVLDILLEDPDIAAVGSFIGSSGWRAGNSASMIVSLKPQSERSATIFEVVDRLRPKMAEIVGANVGFYPAQDLQIGGRESNAQFQYTLWSSDLDELVAWLPEVTQALERTPGLVDVSSDRDDAGPQATVTIDRDAASRLGVKVSDIDAALNDAFAQRQISTIYRDRNQYQVVLDVTAEARADLNSVRAIYVTASNPPGSQATDADAAAEGIQVPLSAVTRLTRDVAPLSVEHQGQFPAVTISYNLAEGADIATATAAIDETVANLGLPDSINYGASGTALSTQQTSSDQSLLLITALLSVYLVLGILYESLRHPVTILSTLPSAGLGALLALQITGLELSLIALLAVVLLIGIVKKNGIMLVDFALHAERERGLPPEQAVYEAAISRFRPITMTTLAALLGAVPLILFTGPGAALRQPLGITIAGGLIVSQLLTVYTTPVIYLWMERLRWPFGKAERSAPTPAAQPAE
ncbi:efflux RND transporter permease subunit [Marinivivus vitaminiproducens]|uniref:efflux RND transporter permease subunit n=1 Tax=Marinivivus vitaminiproducens TaxID=3035935 RepID=UPI0027A9DEDD|nr:efflux RND transporter permease subunit [Geminicoccaceae bacterium SCSIO 64248]